MKRILFITTSNLSSNPRLYKEIRLAEKLGYETSFIAFYQGGWSDEKDKILSKTIRSHSYYISALRKPLWLWMFSSLIHTICIKIWPIFKSSLWVTSIAHSKRSYQILKSLSQIRGHYDLVIGHNLGALYPAWVFAKKSGIPFGFDVEDFHPGEASAKSHKGESERRKRLLYKLLERTVYYSYASPLIGVHTQSLLLTSKPIKNILINNCFSGSEFKSSVSVEGKLKLVWFSQNIAANRGLELIIPVLASFRQEVSLCLIGNLYNDFYEKWIKSNQDFIQVCSPLELSQLLGTIESFDVGLALEPGKDDNNLYALSNKIWAYYQAGLFILATDTPAQELFMNDKTEHGIVIQKSIESIHKAISDIVKNIETIRKGKQERYLKAQHQSWEAESEKLSLLWREIL